MTKAPNHVYLTVQQRVELFGLINEKTRDLIDGFDADNVEYILSLMQIQRQLLGAEDDE